MIVMVMSPHILKVMPFRLGLFYQVTATTVVCCILMQILCVVSQKKIQLLWDFVPPDPLPGLCPGPRWGTPSPDRQFSFMPPNNPVRSSPLALFVHPRILVRCHPPVIPQLCIEICAYQL